jgi:hypothetical protein
VLHRKEETMKKNVFPEQKQQQRKGWRFLLLLIGLVLVAGMGLLAWQVLAKQAPSTSSISNNPHFNTSMQTTTVSKGTPPEVVNDVRQRVAQELHLSVNQLTAKLQLGVPIESLASQQGMSPDEWRTFLIAAYQAAYTKEVSAGKVKQARADHDMHNIRSYPLDALNGWITNDCLGITAQ